MCRSRHLKSAGQPPPVTASCRTASQNFKMGGESHITRGAPSGSPLRLDCQQPACTRSQHFRHAVDTMRDLHLLRNPSSLPSWIHEPESTLPGNGVALSFKRGCGKKKLMYLAGILKDGARLSVGMDLPPRAHSLYKATPVCASQALSAAVSALFVGRQLDALSSLHCNGDLVAELQQNRQQPQFASQQHKHDLPAQVYVQPAKCTIRHKR